MVDTHAREQHSGRVADTVVAVWILSVSTGKKYSSSSAAGSAFRVEKLYRVVASARGHAAKTGNTGVDQPSKYGKSVLAGQSRCVGIFSCLSVAVNKRRNNVSKAQSKQISEALEGLARAATA